ncbi:hypothetical protein HZY97_11415 [Sphingomonas sp. R-74633]|uniref:hypothetical protein n=1 Tax=Sphingomonas sp. R-74633 TaxID=2751188 RepID=UPI0015D3E313|nr:hypothetical protein [Sphingomonas sp. R-74633]NYT41369.1 hypothetical protein [Sphingomonas sp. R-74633]
MNAVDGATRAAILTARTKARETIRAWRGGAAYRGLETAFADCPADDPAPAMARAARLLGNDDWAGTLLDPLLRALSADPLFEPPLKVTRDAMRIGAVLFDCPAISITACRTSAAVMRRLHVPASITFSGRLAVTRYVRAGGAVLRRWQTDPAGPDFRSDGAPPCRETPALRLADGDVHATDGHREAQLLGEAACDVVTLVATIRAGAAPLMREHAIDDGRLLRVASGDERASRTEMLLAFLRVAGRADTSERFEEATRDPIFYLRWAAMREWLGLDARTALPRLEAMAAEDPHSEIRDAATCTLAAVRPRLEAACPA